MNAEVYSHKFVVPASAIDARNHVNNLAYLQWCLDAAQSHWELSASEAIQEEYVWYVLEHTIQYKASAFKGEELQVDTWVTTAEGVKSERQYRIFRLQDQKSLIEAKTLWCLLDAKSLRPTKITDEIRNLFVKI